MATRRTRRTAAAARTTPPRRARRRVSRTTHTLVSALCVAAPGVQLLTTEFAEGNCPNAYAYAYGMSPPQIYSIKL